MLRQSPFLLFECVFRTHQKQFQIEYWNSEYSGISSISASRVIIGWCRRISQVNGTKQLLYSFQDIIAVKPSSSYSNDHGSHGPWDITRTPKPGNPGNQTARCQLRVCRSTRVMWGLGFKRSTSSQGAIWVPNWVLDSDTGPYTTV